MYDGRLVTFPGRAPTPVVDLEPVDGAGVVAPGDDGHRDDRRPRWTRVVELVLEHARTRPQRVARRHRAGHQARQRLDEPSAGRWRRPTASPTSSTRTLRAFFVKNLERVQGDERDAIILSVGYGKTPHGRVLHRFGPLNLEGGERRLNVAITRARRRMTVVSSLTADDLDPSRLKARGAQMLRDFLAYAASGGAAPAAPTGPIATGVVMAEFARRLREAGLVVHEGYGTSGQRVDLAVEDPDHRGGLASPSKVTGAYAALSTTRDRDRLRPEQLERLGWRPMRVWTTGLFRDPARDVARVVTAAQAARLRDVPAGPAEAGDEGDPEETGRLRMPVPKTPDLSGTADDAAAEPTPGPDAAEPEQDPVPEADAGAARLAPPPSVPPRVRVRPEQTADDTDAGWGERRDESGHDRWLREQRPPHWE